MVSLTALWLPVLLSAVVVFIASSVIHMATRWHANDYKKFPAEDAVFDAVRPFNLAPGGYVAPMPQSMAHMSSPEFKAKVQRGPRIALTVLGPENWIWYSTGVGYTVRTTIDGLIYALLMGGVFGWLWP